VALQKLPMGGIVYMSLYEVACFGPLNTPGLQLNPLKMARVMDTAASYRDL